MEFGSHRTLHTARSAVSMVALVLTPSCVVSPERITGLGPGEPEQPQTTYVPSLPVSHPPFDEFHPSWMQGADQPYVYFEHYGPYTSTADHLPALMREMHAQGLDRITESPFCLFYDDPGRVAAVDLYSRACVPYEGPKPPVSPLRYDVVPGRTVAYVIVSGPYENASRAYPKLLEYVASRRWTIDGPFREIYRVPPRGGADADDLLCEIRVPVRPVD